MTVSIVYFSSISKNNDKTNWTKDDTRNDIYLTYITVGWILLYTVYKSNLHSFLRQRRTNVLRRNRLIYLSWNLGFHFILLCYLLSHTFFKVPLITTLELTPPDPNFLLLKSFYLHHAVIQVFSCSWFNGLIHLLFTLFAFNKSPNSFYPCIFNLLLLKSVNVFILDSCRLLLILCTNKFGNWVAELLFLLHSINWTYIHLLFVPDSILSNSKAHLLSQTLYFWIWFPLECYNSMWLNIFRYRKSKCWLNEYLFPPSHESVMLMNIYKRNRESIKKKYVIPHVQKKADLWKTLICAMAVKKKLRRMRKVQMQKHEKLEVKNE